MLPDHNYILDHVSTSWCERFLVAMSPELPSRSEYWYDDGSIILVVGDTAFRVHKSILSQHSDVFADLFTIPEPPKNESDSVDGCSVVHLQDDLKDFTEVIKAIYQPL